MEMKAAETWQLRSEREEKNGGILGFVEVEGGELGILSAALRDSLKARSIGLLLYGRIMIFGKAYAIWSVGVFAVAFVVYLMLRYASDNAFAKWYLPLWAPFCLSTGLICLMLLFALPSRGQWDMGPAIAMIYIGPFLIAFVISLVFRPGEESMNRPGLMATGVLIVVYAITTLYLAGSPFWTLKVD